MADTNKINEEITPPMKRYMCSTCMAMYPIEKDQDPTSIKCCDNPKPILLSEEYTNKEEKDALPKLREAYLAIQEVISRYMDITEHQKILVTTWILGTYFHKEFHSFPFLFINAMKGSGKTRLLKLIEKFCYEGKLTNNITEAVLFRTAQNHTIIIDEIENITSKDKSTLRELLNSCYKRGNYVERMRKKYTKEGDVQVVERFHLFTPVVMANIYGMDEVLGDRCIPIIIEKSNDAHKIKLIENFDDDFFISEIKELLKCSFVVLCNLMHIKETIQGWNKYVDLHYKYIYTYNTYNTYIYIKQHNTPQQEKVQKDAEIQKINKDLYDKIIKTGIEGRDLELFLPLFVVAKFIGNDVFEKMIEIANENVKEKKEDAYTTSKDIAVIDFVAKRDKMLGYNLVKELTQEFKMFYDSEDGDYDWLNAKWMGRALKRLGLILDKKREQRGMKIMLDITKARERIKYFHLPLNKND